MKDLPIGIFDSGLGGLTVVKEVMKLLPDEAVIYFGDTARVPYGTKSPEVVRKFSLQIMDFLLKQKVKMIVVACNTASACSAAILKEKTKIPIIEMIDPGSRAALHSTYSVNIGVIGTDSTIKSGAYTKALRAFNPGANVISKACPLFVPMIEEGWFGGSHKNIVKQVAAEYLAPVKKEKIDTLILGCTHYPLIKDIIAAEMGKKVKLVDSAHSAAAEIKAVLYTNGIKSTRSAPPRHTFYVSDAPEKCEIVASKILGMKISQVKKIDIERYGAGLRG